MEWQHSWQQAAECHAVTLSRWRDPGPGLRIRRCLAVPVPDPGVCVLAIIMKRWWLQLWNTRSQAGEGCKSEMLLECLTHGRWTCSCGFVWTPETLHKMVSDSSWSDEIWATRPSGYNHPPDLDRESVTTPGLSRWSLLWADSWHRETVTTQW